VVPGSIRVLFNISTTTLSDLQDLEAAWRSAAQSKALLDHIEHAVGDFSVEAIQVDRSSFDDSEVTPVDSGSPAGVDHGDGDSSIETIIIIVTTVGVSVVLCAVVAVWVARRSKKKPQVEMEAAMVMLHPLNGEGVPFPPPEPRCFRDVNPPDFAQCLKLLMAVPRVPEGRTDLALPQPGDYDTALEFILAQTQALFQSQHMRT